MQEKRDQAKEYQKAYDAGEEVVINIFNDDIDENKEEKEEGKGKGPAPNEEADQEGLAEDEAMDEEETPEGSETPQASSSQWSGGLTIQESTESG